MFSREEWSSSVPDIPPGHRILLSTFMQDTRNNLMDKSKPKALKVTERCAPAVKRSSSISSSNSNTEIVDVAEDLDLAGATSKIRHQIVKWQCTQNNIQLREHSCSRVKQ